MAIDPNDPTQTQQPQIIAPTVPAVANATTPSLVAEPPTTPLLAPMTTPAPAPTTLEGASTALGVQQPPTLILSPNSVYSAPNIASATQGKTKAPNYSKMSADKLAKAIADASNTAELAQISIENQRVPMSLITGRQAQAGKLADYHINALTKLYGAKKAELDKKEAERQDFIAKYGEDPKSRPRGMSVREFQASLLAKGGTPIQMNQEMERLKLTQLRNAVMGTGGKTNIVLANAHTNILNSRGTDGFADPTTYQRERNNYANAGGNTFEFDKQFGALLSPKEQVNVIGAAQGGTSEALVASIMQNPTQFKTLSADKKAELMPFLSARGFDFKAAEAASATKPNQKKLGQVAVAETDIKRMGELATKVNDVGNDYAAQISGWRKTGIINNKNIPYIFKGITRNDLEEYERLRNTLTLEIAPLLGIASVSMGNAAVNQKLEQYVPNFYDSKGNAEQKMARLQQLLDQSRQSAQTSGATGTTDPDLAELEAINAAIGQ